VAGEDEVVGEGVGEDSRRTSRNFNMVLQHGAKANGAGGIVYENGMKSYPLLLSTGLHDILKRTRALRDEVEQAGISRPLYNHRTSR